MNAEGNVAGRHADRLGYPLVELPAEAAASSDSAIRYLIGQLVEWGHVPASHASRAACEVVTRERQGSTTLATGVAVPHSKSDVPEPVGIIGRSSVQIPWESSSAVPVHEVCLLLLPVTKPQEYIRALKEAVAVLSEM
jgi:mannitol/fructose-specific phosphotransferase system IIA component (Ntr-type)